jgi:hypothetical protein
MDRIRVKENELSQIQKTSQYVFVKFLIICYGFELKLSTFTIKIKS